MSDFDAESEKNASGCFWKIVLIGGLIIGAYCYIREKMNDHITTIRVLFVVKDMRKKVRSQIMQHGVSDVRNGIAVIVQQIVSPPGNYLRVNDLDYLESL